MSKLERFLKMTQTASQLKKLRWEEEDRAEQSRIRQSLLNLMSPEEYAALQSGLLKPEDLGIGKRTAVPKLKLPKFETRKLGALKGEPSGLPMGKAKGLRFKPAPEAAESPFGQLPSFADVEPQHYEKLARLLDVFSGAEPTDKSTRWKQLAGTIEKQPYEYEHLEPGQIPKASRIAAKLEAGETSRAETADERAKRYEDIPEDKRTTFHNKFLEKYYGEGKSTQLERDKEYVRRRLTTIVTSAITERAKQGETISKALALKTPEVRDVLTELKPIYPDAVKEILAEMGVMEIPPSWGAELDKYNSYDEFYKSLSSEEQSSIEPEEEKAMKQYYGTF